MLPGMYLAVTMLRRLEPTKARLEPTTLA